MGLIDFFKNLFSNNNKENNPYQAPKNTKEEFTDLLKIILDLYKLLEELKKKRQELMAFVESDIKLISEDESEEEQITRWIGHNKEIISNIDKLIENIPLEGKKFNDWLRGKSYVKISSKYYYFENNKRWIKINGQNLRWGIFEMMNDFIVKVYFYGIIDEDTIGFKLLKEIESINDKIKVLLNKFESEKLLNI
jgi:hypothetical protein